MLSKRHGPYLPEAFSYVGLITYVKAHRTVPGTLSIHISFLTVMVNFMCYFDWDMRCPDIWLKIISGCVCEVVSR